MDQGTESKTSLDFIDTTAEQGRPLAKDTRLTTTVDTLLLPGVIGTTVEGPKTPLRSSRVNRGSVSAYNQVSSIRNLSDMTTPPDYYDNQNDSDDQFSPPTYMRGQGRSKSETPKKDRIQPRGLGFRTPQPLRTLNSAEWRLKYRPHDTPIAQEKHSSARISASTAVGKTARPQSGRSQKQRSSIDPYDYYSMVQEGEDGEEGLILDSHDGKGTKFNHGHLHAVDATDDDDMHMADDSGLDVGSDREGQDQSSYDSLAYRDLSDTHAYSDEESLTRRIKREEYKEAKKRRREEKARLKQINEETREKNQLGFLRRLVNLFSPDDLGDDSSIVSRNEDESTNESDSEETDDPPPYHASISTPHQRLSPSNTALLPSTPPHSRYPVSLQRNSSHSSTRSYDTPRPLAAKETRNVYYDITTSDDNHSRDTSPRRNGLDIPDDQLEDLLSEEDDHMRNETTQVDQHYYRQGEYRHQRQPQDFQPAVPRVYPWHVIARICQQQYQNWSAIVSSLATTLLDTALGFRDALAALLFALWTAIITFFAGMSAWFREGVNSGLFSPRTLASVGLLMLAIIVSNMLANSGLVERSWDSLVATYRTPVSTSLDMSTLAAAMGKFGSGLLGRKSSPTSSAPWNSNINQASPSNANILDSKIQKQQASRLEAIETRLSLVQKTLEQLDGADQDLEARLMAQLKDLALQISTVDSKVDHVVQDVNSLKHRLQSGLWLNQTVMEMIQDELPRYLVVAKNSTTGQPMIPAEFWQMAREMFVTAEEATQLIKDQMAKELASVINDNISPENPKTDRAVSEWRWISEFTKRRQKSRQWANFLKEHEKALNELVDQRQAVVSRQSFLGLVRTEANSIWRAIEPQALSWLESRGHLSSPNPSTSSESNNAFTGNILTEAERGAMSLLIDEALERYTADVIAKPDYALFSAGGRIIPKLTSPIYSLSSLMSLISEHITHAFDFVLRPAGWMPPEFAIRPGTTPGECWAIYGSDGQLGIRLARHIFPTAVTVEHADRRVVYDMKSAPKDFEVWGIPATDDSADDIHISKDEKGEEDQSQWDGNSESTEKAEAHEEDNVTEEVLEAPSPDAILLMRGRYQVDMPTVAETPDAPSSPPPSRALQTFPVPLSKQNVLMRAIVFRITSNWGNPDYTCLYRVRVHGQEPKE
ncbi:hypothetical protein BGW42_006121 [Actinomortierella wolfii]|nr:hypothetical protein BGW42_006121 [Actinomortierella wolfii]